MRMQRSLIAFLVAAVLVWPSTEAQAETDSALCATPAQLAGVEARLTRPRANYWTIAEELKATEASVVAAIAARDGAIVGPERFGAVWTSLTRWPEAVAVLLKDGHVFEVHGRILPGELSKQSQFFNLKGHDGLAGHLRPDLIGAIYAVSWPMGKNTQRAVLFADRRGSISFGVYVPAEGAEPDAAVVAAFDATRAEMAKWPPRCGSST